MKAMTTVPSERAAPTPVVSFVGPSLPAAEVARRFPDVLLLPPICQGDLLSAWERYHPEVCVIIDGEFGQSLSVWHKEILYVLNQGVHVVGASSMGALRAAEMERFGMVGVGKIFEHFSGGFLTADDEVALLHGDADMGWQPFTWPLVNCTATITNLRATGLIDEAEADLLVDALSSLHFSERIAPALAEELGRRGRADAEELAAMLADAMIDQKALDAIAGIEHGLSLIGVSMPVLEAPLHLFGRVGESMAESDTLVPSATTPLRRYQLVNDLALHDADFEQLSQRAIDRLLALEYAFETGATVTAEEIASERARFLLNRSLTEDDLGAWLVANDLDEGSFTRLMEEEALRRRMQRWALDTRLYGRNRKIIIDQLRLEGRYPEAVRQASRRRLLADARPPQPWPTSDAEGTELLIKHHISSGWRAQGSLDATIEDHGFDGMAGLFVGLLDATAARIEASERRERLVRIFGADSGSTEPSESARRAAAGEVHRLLESHQVSQVILAAVELGLFDHLDQPRSTADLARRLFADPALLRRLCQALAALELLNGDDDGWRPTSKGEVLAEGHDASLAPYARDLRRSSQPAWGELAALVRGADQGRYEGGADADQGFSAATWGLDMDRRAARLVPEDFEGSVVDLGGGLGRLAVAIAERAPRAKVILVERPEVIEAARVAVAGHDVTVVALDEVGGPIDLVMMSRVLCTLDDEAVVALLGTLRPALAPAATIHVIDTVHDGSVPASLVDLFNLVRTGGLARSESEWRDLADRVHLKLHDVAPFEVPFSDLVLCLNLDSLTEDT